MNTSEIKSIDCSLKSIAKSLSILAEDTKASKDLKLLEIKKENRFTTFDLVKDQFLTFTLGIVVGCMLLQLGTELLK